MATVYSLVCFGGRTGKTVTFTDAGDVVNLTNHGLRHGAGVVFSNAGGALPTGLAAGTTYYAKQGADQNKFLLYPTSSDAIAGTNQVTFSGTGTGTHTAKSAWMLGLSAPELARYGSPGSERIYDGIVAWNTARTAAPASQYDTEVCEIGEAFSDILTAALVVSVPSAQNVIHTRIGDSRANGFHFGKCPLMTDTLATLALDSGYVIYNSSVTSGLLLTLNRYRDTLDGVVVMNKANASLIILDISVVCRSYNNIIIQATGSPFGVGLNLRAALAEAVGNTIVGFATGTSFASSQLGLLFANNLVTKCTNAFSASSTVRGFFYNNISVGNVTTNWSTQPTNLEGADKNAGLSGEAWVTGSGARVTIATTDVADHTNNKFYPAASTSPQVETGTSFYGYPTEDISGEFRPAYMGGSAAMIDIGPFEFDHGYGPWPASHELTLTNVVVGSRVFVEDQAGTVVHFDEVAAASTVVIAQTVYGDSRDNWRIKVRKASASPYYLPYETLMTATAGASSIYVSQLPDE